MKVLRPHQQALRVYNAKSEQALQPRCKRAFTWPSGCSLRKTLFSSQILALGLLASSSCLAIEERGQVHSPLLQMNLEQLLNIEVTGSTNDRRTLFTAPSAVTVFTHSEIEALGVASLNQLVNFAPGFQSNRNGDNSNFHPFSSRSRRISRESAEVLVLVDGQRLDSPRTSGSANIVPRYPLANIERIEFIRGPGSALYGSNAMQGVINIITRTDTNSTSMELGSFDHKQLQTSSSTQLNAWRIDGFLQLQKDKGDQYSILTHVDPESKARTYTQTQDPRQHIDANLKLTRGETKLNLQHYESHTKDFYEVGTIANGVNRHTSVFSSAWLEHTVHWTQFSTSIAGSYRRTSNTLTAQTLPPGTLLNVSQPPSNAPLMGGNKKTWYSERQLLWTNHWDINAHNQFQFGVEYRHIHAPQMLVTSNYNMNDLINNRIPIRYFGEQGGERVVQYASFRDIYGLYAQHQITPIKNLELTIGIRGDKFSNIGQRPSPRLAAVFQLNKNNSVKLLYSEAFRAPSESELNLVNNSRFLGNPNLKPEYVKSTEAIWMNSWKTGSFSAGVFEHKFFNSIILQSVGGDLLQNANVDQAPVRGAEFELAYQPTKALFVRAAYTSIFNKPESAHREASRFGSVNASYRYQTVNIGGGVYWHGKTEMQMNGDASQLTPLDPFFNALVKVDWEFKPGWHSYITVDNALDKEIYTPPENPNLLQGIPNRHRSINIGLKRKF